MESYIVDKITCVDIVKRLIKCYSSIRFDVRQMQLVYLSTK